jgi:hypothetical protein
MKREPILFSLMCDRCFRMLYEGEDMYAMKLIDDNDEERLFKGHKECVEDIREILRQLYGRKKDNGEENSSN